MKLVGNWYVPDYEENLRVLTAIENEDWGCKETLKKSFKYLEKFHTAIDVGTWIGDSTSIIAQQFQNTIGFEANTDVFECCQKNLKNFKNILLYNFALSNSVEEKKLFLGNTTFSAWINSLEQSQIINKSVVEKKIQCQTLDSFNFKNIDFLKIDIDSHEGYFLQGCQIFFKNNSPVILIEYKPKIRDRQNISMPDPIQLLTSIGYKIKEKVSHIDYVLTRE